jgi:type IV secretory pathway protease TraF
MKVFRNRLYWSCAITLAAVIAVQVVAWPKYQLIVNETNSIEGTVFVWEKNQRLEKGQIAILKWKGGAGYETNSLMLKTIVGTPGDSIESIGRQVRVNGVHVADALSHSPSGKPLEVIESQIIPHHAFLAVNPSSNSFDGRYRVFGLLDENVIVGRAHKVF